MKAGNPPPVYLKLLEKLSNLLKDGSVRRGDRFLTERQVSERYGVSRPTANKILTALVASGALEYRKGIGTFVRLQHMDHDLHRLVSFSEKASAMGLNPSTTVLDFIPMPIAEAPTQVRISLCSASVQDDAEALIYMKRLRFVDGIPVILEHRYLRSQYCPDLMPEELAGSLYRLISEKYALKIYRAEECIRAINLNQQEAKVLQIARRTAAIEVTGTASVSDGSPLWWERTVFRGDVFEFRNVLGEDSAGTPPHGVIMNAQFCPAYGGERSRQ